MQNIYKQTLQQALALNESRREEIEQLVNQISDVDGVSNVSALGSVVKFKYNDEQYVLSSSDEDGVWDAKVVVGQFAYLYDLERYTSPLAELAATIVEKADMFEGYDEDCEHIIEAEQDKLYISIALYVAK